MESDNSSPSVRDKAVYAVLRFIGDNIKDDSTSDDSKESLEGILSADLPNKIN